MKKFWCNGKKDFCDTSKNCINCEYYANLGGAEIEVKEVKTNYDKITSSVESLAEFIIFVVNESKNQRRLVSKILKDKNGKNELKKTIKEWLQKECEG